MTDIHSTRKRTPEACKARLESPDKFCAKCAQTKSKAEFAAMAGRADGLRPYCRPCKAQESREYRERNPEKSLEASRRWIKNNKEKKTAANKAWVEKNRERYNRVARQWRHNNKDRMSAFYQKRKDDISYRLNHTISSRIYLSLKGKGGKRTKEILGYTTEELIDHLERQFTNGMSWDNYGQWHIDHIQPLISFTITSMDDPELLRAWGLPNLRPLWAQQNSRKHAKRTHLI